MRMLASMAELSAWFSHRSLEVLLTATTTPAAGAATAPPAMRPFTAEELADRQTPASPAVSPDGRQVAYVVMPSSQKGEKAAHAIWVAGEDESPRQLTAGTHADGSPRWSPDGQHLVFISDRLEKDDDGSQLFLLPIAGGEATPLGILKGSLSLPKWSPDGRFVAVLRTDPEPEVIKKRKKDRDDAIVVEEEPYFTRLWAIEVATGKARTMTTAAREVRDYDWLPESDGFVVLTTNDIGWDAVMGPSQLWETPLSGGRSRLIADLRTTGSLPVVVDTASGRKVALRIDGHREQPSDSIWTVAFEGGEATNLLPELSGIVEGLAEWPGNPGMVAARIVERTRARLYSVDVETGELTALTPPAMAEKGSIIGGPSFSRDGSKVALLWSDSTTPEELFLGSTASDPTRVTSLGEAFVGRLQPVEHVTWLSDGGVEIEGLLTYPVGYETGKRYPLVVEIHGGPSWQWEDRVMLDWHDWAQVLASHGYAVLMPNPRGSTAYGHEFQQLLQDDVGGGESRDLVTGALAMVERGIADPERLGIGGWSWGGYLTAWTITQTDIFKAAIMGAGLSNLISDHGQDDIPSANLLYFPGHPYDHMEMYWAASPIRHIANVKTPTLILHGDSDARVHPAQGMEYFRALKIRGIPVRFVRYPREKHGISERAHQIDLMDRIVDWLARYLPAGASSADA
jgi:dipeptidyl aminopeptidase/acylaminoacyl peptidase